MNQTEQKAAAKAFADRWAGRGDEKQDTQSFWNELLRTVYGVDNTEEYIKYEKRAKIDKDTKFIDGYIPATKVLIEQKGAKIDLNKAERQSDGQMLTPFQQGRRYILGLKQSEYPKWIVTCNFQTFHIHDMDRPNDAPQVVYLKDLPKEFERLTFLIDLENKNTKREEELSKGAGELVGKIYDAFMKQFEAVREPTAGDLRSLNVLCVRLVFCYYAEDAGLFQSAHSFRDYLDSFNPRHLQQGLKDLFAILDTPEPERDPFAAPELLAFPYVNGRLFRDENQPITIPPITEEIKKELLDADDFDWSDISPTIFGAVFESTLDSKMRRKGGMHYTSITNIHKVIDPLFLDDLKAELKDILAITVEKKRDSTLKNYQNKLASLTFLDPAAGSGNFLTESYRCLRKLENRVIAELHHGQTIMYDEKILNPIKVSIGQFYGIEINDFAVSVAKTALWIAESQMLQATEEIIQGDLDFLPLTTNANIVEGNALRIDWNDVVPKEKLDYIMGNPPFVGASMMTKEQKSQATEIYGKIKLSNSIDYVGAWYFKSSQMMQNTKIRAALVSTNSICQGEQVAPLWGTLKKRYNIHIDFAYRTFKWNSEAAEKAAVHCVIIGFSIAENTKTKIIYSGDMKNVTEHINAYLIDAPDAFITSRSKPICNVPKMTKGNQPTDGGNLILSEAEKDELLKNDPSQKQCIRRYIGAKDYLNGGEKRYCLWLKDIDPNIYKNNKEIMQRLNLVREKRLASSAAPTRRSADWPYKFFSTPQTDEIYLLIPRVSSERRKYIPIGFMSPKKIAADSCSIICGANLYMFGILSSNVHMQWMRTVAGRLEMRYRYSGGIVYNNFPWPTPTTKQKKLIEKTARDILNARKEYPGNTLAELYDPDKEWLYPKLRVAHEQNNRAVMLAYGFTHKDKDAASKWYTESETVAALMKMYQELTEK
jgi:type I restriction-modification system DNA methylase subunit